MKMSFSDPLLGSDLLDHALVLWNRGRAFGRSTVVRLILWSRATAMRSLIRSAVRLSHLTIIGLARYMSQILMHNSDLG